MYMYFSHPSISVPLRLYPLMNGDFSLLSLGASSFCNGFSLFNFAFHHDFSRFTLPLFLPPVNGFQCDFHGGFSSNGYLLLQSFALWMGLIQQQQAYVLW